MPTHCVCIFGMNLRKKSNYFTVETKPFYIRQVNLSRKGFNVLITLLYGTD